MRDAFSLLSKNVQHAIYDMKWTKLRSIQVDAIVHLLTSERDLIISAPTASGKTEAAFLPIISKIDTEKQNSVSVLYISPLKALINDQFLRITDLCKRLDIKITKWHGDANMTKKEALLKKPTGILLITPESLEALFVNKSSKLQELFSDLKYMVIDEIHSFIGTSRGTQLHSLLSRLNRYLKKPAVKIGLSATINDTTEITRWFSYQHPENVKVINDTGDSKEIRGIIKAFQVDIPLSDKSKKQEEKFLSALYKTASHGKNLIFSNSKRSLEIICDDLREKAETEKNHSIFRIHHGSLSKEIREDTEDELKKANNLSVFCTSTLELGIDIGNIDKILFLAPPIKVSSFIQRLGRCGRKEGQAKEFFFFLRTPNPPENILDYIQFSLVKSIAIVELMLQNWCEPLNGNMFDYSTFVQQILSFVTQNGSVSIKDIYDELNVRAFNKLLEKQEVVLLLRYLNDKKLIRQNGQGLIELDAIGERIVEHYDFYAAFQSTSGYDVIYNGTFIGEILEKRKINDAILLAGKRWTIVDVKDHEKIILVKKGAVKKPVIFGGKIGGLHRIVHRKMKEIYDLRFIPKYIDQNTKDILKNAYSMWEEFFTSKYTPIFEGDRICNTLALILSSEGCEQDLAEYGIYSDKEKLSKILNNFDFDKTSPFDLIRNIGLNKVKNKYDSFLPQELLDKQYVSDSMDWGGTKEFIQNFFK